MDTKKQIKLLTLYSAGHFTEDLACAFLMISLALNTPADAIICLLLYNFCAFAMQMPMGLIADKCNRNAAIAVLGLALTLAAFLFYPLPLLCSVIAGMGNCLYHIGGGVDILHFSNKKQWMLGIYVSPGAVGLFLGTLLAQQRLISLPFGFFMILLAAVLISLLIHMTHRLNSPSGNIPLSLKATGRASAVAVILLFLVVVLRSYGGSGFAFDWKSGTWAFIAVLGLACGKAVGGFLADRFGAIPASAVTLSLSALLFMLSDIAICGVLAIFLFNMTMPLTLFALTQVFSGARGFAFGILTFALFIGALPMLLKLPPLFEGEKWWYAIESLISLVLLSAGLIAAKNVGGEADE